MKHRIWFRALALGAVLTIVATACAGDDDGDTGTGGVDCATVDFGCVEVGPDDPINIGVSQVISGADATLGQDQVNGIELALDFRGDETFDGTNGTVLDHAVELTVEDDGCSAEGGQAAATIADESPYTQGLVAAFEQNFEAGGGTITGTEQVNSEDTDFKAPLRSLAEGNPDILYFPIFVAACTLVVKQAQEIMPDAALMVADGCLSSDTLKNAGPDADGVFASSPDPSGTADPFYADELIPAYQEAFGSAPLSVFHGHAYDATNILLDAIEAVAIENDDGSLTIPRQALRDEVFATEGYEGMIGTITCTDTGDCATDVTIGIFLGPGWDVEGGTGDRTPVYTDTKSLDDVL